MKPRGLPHRTRPKARGHTRGGIYNDRTISTAPANIVLGDPGYARDLNFLRASVDLELKPDGSLTK